MYAAVVDAKVAGMRAITPLSASNAQSGDSGLVAGSTFSFVGSSYSGGSDLGG